MRRQGLLFAAAAALSLFFAALVGGDDAQEATDRRTPSTSVKSDATSAGRASTSPKRSSERAEGFDAPAPSSPVDRASSTERAPTRIARGTRHEADVDQRGEVEEYVREERRTDTDGLEEEQLPGGGVQVVLHDRFRNVPVATITEDGEVRIEH